MNKVIFTAAFGLLFFINEAVANYRPIHVGVHKSYSSGVALKTSIDVAGIAFYATIDTGATSSVISESAFRSIVRGLVDNGFRPESVIRKISDGVASFADGGESQVVIYSIPASIGGIKHKNVSFMVLSNASSTLIGMDALAAFGAVIDTSSNQVLVRD